MAATTKYYATSSGSEKLEEIDEEEQLMWQSEHRHRNDYNHDEEEDCIEEKDDEEDELMIEDASSMSSSPSIPDENINFDLVYALHTFVATVEGQASVVKGDALILMEDTNIYWWLVEVLKTREVGYIPAENIETPYERLARLNKHRNVEITSPSINNIASLPIAMTHPLHPARRVTIGDESMSKIFHYEVESDIEEDDLVEDEDCLIIEDEHFTDEEEAEVYQDAHQNEFHEITYDDDNDDQHHQQQQQQQQVKEDWQEKSWEEEDQVPTQAETVSQQPKEEEQQQQQQKMDLRVFAGNIGQGPLFHTFPILVSTTADELVKIAVNKFGMMDNIEPSEDTTIEYYLAVQGMDGDEYILSGQDKPFSIFKTLTDSLTTPMPSLSHIRRISQQSMSSTLSTSSRRPRSSSFSNYEQTSYDEDSVIRFYLHRRIKRAIEREGLLYIKVSLYPDETAITITNNNEAVTSASAFIKNPTTPNIRLTKKRQQRQQQKSEIDRIDKIISVRKEYPIGVVINLALEKFHVPDAQADDYFCGKNERDNSRQLGKYRMSVRGNGQETELNPNELMSNVLLAQQQNPPNQHGGPITSDLSFVLRKTGNNKLSQRQRYPSKGSNVTNNSKLLPSQLSTSSSMNTTSAAGLEDRRPSILDILMDSTPKMMGERRPSVMSNLLDPLPPPRFAEDNNNNNRRPSGSTMNNGASQERKQSLNNNSSPSSSSSSSFPTAKSPNSLSPSILGFNRRSSVQSSSVISGTSSIEERTIINSNSTIIMDILQVEVTPTSSSSIMTRSIQPSTSTSTEVTTSSKKKESLKQQFRRFVGWGSSTSSKKSTLVILPPLTTTPPPFHSNNIMDSPSDISFVSAPSTPLPPTPSTPRSFASRSRQGSHQLHGERKLIMEVNTPTSLSRRPSETTTLNDPSAAALTVAAAVVNNKRLSTVSSVSSSSNTSTSSVTSEELAAAAKQGLVMDGDDSDESDNEQVKKVATTKEEAMVTTLVVEQQQKQQEPQSVATVAEDTSAQDIQQQYAMWMNSPSPTEITTTFNNNAVLNMAIMNKALPPVIQQESNNVPARNPLRNKASTISNTTNTNQAASSIVDTTTSQCTTSSIMSTITTSKQEIIEEPPVVVAKNQEPLHPMPTNNGQDLDDLFLLVAHGVDFLTSRENTKWEEEGGYEFHPWNRPQSSFAIRQQEQRSIKDMPSLPSGNDEQRDQQQQQEEGNNSDSTSAALAMARSLLLSPSTSTTNEEESNKLISPPLTPLPQQPAEEQQHVQQESPLSTAKRILGSKPEIATPIIPIPSVQSQPQQSVDDEELQRIVAAHIVF